MVETQNVAYDHILFRHGQIRALLGEQRAQGLMKGRILDSKRGSEFLGQVEQDRGIFRSGRTNVGYGYGVLAWIACLSCVCCRCKRKRQPHCAQHTL